MPVGVRRSAITLLSPLRSSSMASGRCYLIIAFPGRSEEGVHEKLEPWSLSTGLMLRVFKMPQQHLNDRASWHNCESKSLNHVSGPSLSAPLSTLSSSSSLPRNLMPAAPGAALIFFPAAGSLSAMLSSSRLLFWDLLPPSPCAAANFAFSFASFFLSLFARFLLVLASSLAAC